VTKERLGLKVTRGQLDLKVPPAHKAVREALGLQEQLDLREVRAPQELLAQV